MASASHTTHRAADEDRNNIYNASPKQKLISKHSSNADDERTTDARDAKFSLIVFSLSLSIYLSLSLSFNIAYTDTAQQDI
jgi:hypothetical protein